MAKMLSNLADFIVYFADGSLNAEATGSAVCAALEAELHEARRHDTAIEAALDRLFDTVPVGTRLPTPVVTQTVAGELAAGNIAAMVTLGPVVAAFIARSPRFESKRGRSGGLTRIG